MDKFSIKSGLQDLTLKGKITEKPEVQNFSQITFNGKTFNVNLFEELKIDENDLIESMVKHAGNYGWWASLNDTARRLLREKKSALRDTRSSLDGEARSALKEEGIKVTEAAVEAYLSNDPRISKFNDDTLPLEDIVNFTEMVLKALEHKRDMLKEINRAQCNERFNENHQ